MNMLLCFVNTYAHLTETERFTSFSATWKRYWPTVSDISGYHFCVSVLP